MAIRHLLLRLYPSRRSLATSALRTLHSKRGEVSPGTGRQADLSGLGPKRFYDLVSTKQLDDGTYAVTLDGKAVKTPRLGTLAAPTLALATAVAAEWDAQEGRIRPSSMPLTTLVSTARDIIPHEREQVIDGVLKFLDTDTVCIRPAYPSELVKVQDEVYKGVVDHLKTGYEIELNIVRGGLAAPQEESARIKLRDTFDVLDDYSLSAVDAAASAAKSVAIAVALKDAAITPVQAVAAARSEEQWQMGVWGCVEGGHDLDDADILVRLAAADAVLRFVKMQPDVFPGGKQ